MLFFLSTCVKTQLKKEKDFSIPNIQQANPDSALILSPELQDEKSEVIYINGNTKIYIAENTITNLSKVNSEFVVIQKSNKPLIEKKSPKKREIFGEGSNYIGKRNQDGNCAEKRIEISAITIERRQ